MHVQYIDSEHHFVDIFPLKLTCSLFFEEQNRDTTSVYSFSVPIQCLGLHLDLCPCFSACSVPFALFCIQCMY